MEIGLLLPLVVLALIDSLSIGTLLLPLFFLIAPGRLRAGRVLVYLGTIGSFYLVVGLVLATGAGWLAGLLDAVGDSEPLSGSSWCRRRALVGALVLGRAAPKRGTPEADAVLRRPPGRLAGWRDAALHGAGTGPVIAVALGAGLLELATMLPYLGAISLFAGAGLQPVAFAAVLAAYCAIMIVPALVLLLLRAVLRRAIEPPLHRLAEWLPLNGAENTAWIVGIVGFLLLSDALDRLPALAALGVSLG